MEILQEINTEFIYTQKHMKKREKYRDFTIKCVQCTTQNNL